MPNEVRSLVAPPPRPNATAPVSVATTLATSINLGSFEPTPSMTGTNSGTFPKPGSFVLSPPTAGSGVRSGESQRLEPMDELAQPNDAEEDGLATPGTADTTLAGDEEDEDGDEDVGDEVELDDEDGDDVEVETVQANDDAQTVTSNKRSGSTSTNSTTTARDSPNKPAKTQRPPEAEAWVMAGPGLRDQSVRLDTSPPAQPPAVAVNVPAAAAATATATATETAPISGAVATAAPATGSTQVHGSMGTFASEEGRGNSSGGEIGSSPIRPPRSRRRPIAATTSSRLGVAGSGSFSYSEAEAEGGASAGVAGSLVLSVPVGATVAEAAADLVDDETRASRSAALDAVARLYAGGQSLTADQVAVWAELDFTIF